MAEKLTTIDQLKKLALRTKADSAARISELAEMIVAGLEDAQIGFTVTLPAANWSGRAQTVQHESFPNILKMSTFYQKNLPSNFQSDFRKIYAIWLGCFSNHNRQHRTKCDAGGEKFEFHKLPKLVHM